MDYYYIIEILLGFLFTITCFHLLSSVARRTRNLPPGPTPLPIIGSLHLLGAQPLLSLNKLTRKYGPLMCLNLGQTTTVIVSSPSVAREFLQKNDSAFSGKRIHEAVRAHDHHIYGFLWQPANSWWRSIKKIMTTHIFTNERLEMNRDLRLKKVHELIALCQECCETGEAVEMGQAFFNTTLNLMCNTLFSRDFTDLSLKSKPDPKEFKHCLINMLLEVGRTNMVDFFPVLRVLDPQGIRRRTAGYLIKLLDIIDGLINERLEQRRLKAGAAKNDVLDIFLTYHEEHPDEIDIKYLKHSLMDVLIAGLDTTSSLVEYTLAELIKNPEVMKKAKHELEVAIGKGKILEESDISRLPYLDCVIKEAMRLHPPSPVLFPRQPEQDVEVCGYTIPKGSQVLISIWELGRDPSLWKDPREFIPERFEESKIDYRGHSFELLPFGSGRRMCPGIPLAIKLVPLMMGSLINLFNWRLEGGVAPEDLNMEEEVGLTLHMAHPLRAVPVPL